MKNINKYNVPITTQITQPNTYETYKEIKIKGALIDCGNIYRLSTTHICGAKLTKDLYFRKTCNLKYCVKPECKSKLFATFLERLESVKFFQNTRSFIHGCISFEKIKLNEYRNNYGELNTKKLKKDIKARQQTARKYVNRCIKAICKIKGYKGKLENQPYFIGGMVLDLTDDANNRDELFIHFHIFLKPFKFDEARRNLKIMKLIEKNQKAKQRVKIPFHYQQFKGLKEKNGVWSYIALRKAGLYKNHNFTFKFKKVDGKVKTETLHNQIRANKYLFLQDFFSIKEYSNLFHNLKGFYKIGKYSVPYSSKSSYIETYSNNSNYKIPKICKCCGKPVIEKEIIRVISSVDVLDPPDEWGALQISMLMLGRKSYKNQLLNEKSSILKKCFFCGIEKECPKRIKANNKINYHCNECNIKKRGSN